MDLHHDLYKSTHRGKIFEKNMFDNICCEKKIGQTF